MRRLAAVLRLPLRLPLRLRLGRPPRRPPGQPGRGRAALLAAVLLVPLAAGCSSGASTGGPHRGHGGPGGPFVVGYDGPPGTGAPNPFGVKWDWPRIDQYAPYLRGVSGGAAFYEVAWCDVEPTPGAPNWSTVDRVVSSTRRLGYTPLLKIRVGSCWADGNRGGQPRGNRGKTASAMPTDLARYVAFVRTLVARYRTQGVHEYAVENEPNVPQSWVDSPARYVQLVRVAAGAIRGADPQARVVDGGISSTAYGAAMASELLAAGKQTAALAAYRAYYARRFGSRADDFPVATTVAQLRPALGSAAIRRDLAFLDATFGLVRAHVTDVYQLHFYEPWQNVPGLVGYLHARLPAGYPVEAWEVGMFWPGGTGDAQERATELTKTATLLLAGGVRRVIWLPLAVNPNGRHSDEPRYGLLDPSGQERATGRALAQLVSASRGASVEPVTDSDFTGIVFSQGTRSNLVVWSEGGGRLRPSSAVGGAHLVGVDGSSAPSGGAVTVGPNPLLITVAAPASSALRLLS